MGRGNGASDERTNAGRATGEADGGSPARDGLATTWRDRHLTRRRVTALAAGIVAVGAAGWLRRPAPVSNAPGWRVGAALPAGRGEMKAATLDGRIYVPGGLAGSGSSVARLDVYDATTGEWTQAASMPTGLNHHATATLDDRIYVVGGNGGITDPPGAAAFAYDPDADVWDDLPPMPDGRWGHEAVALDGRLYVAGGVPASDDDLETFVYDPGGETWDRVAPIPTPREHVAAAVLDGEVVVVGGRWDGDLTDAVEAYDPETDAWRGRAPVPTARSGFGAAVVDGALHAVGGEYPSSVGGWTTDAHERFDPATDTWESLPDAPLSLHGNAVAATGGELYVLGGAWRQGLWSITAWSDHTFVFDPDSA